MSRRRSRVSRTLLGVMVLTLGVGAGIYYARAHRGEKTVAKAAAPVVMMASNPPAAVVVATTEPAAVVAATQSTTRVATTEPVLAVPSNAAAVIGEGKEKIDSGDLIGGRKLLNDALLAGALSSEDAQLAKRIMAEANRVIVFSPRRFAGDAFQSTHTVTPGEKLQKIAASDALSWEFLGQINNLSDPRRMRAGATLKTIQGPFDAVVNKKAFTMDIWLGSPEKAGGMYVTTLPVGLGRDDSTPTGTWMAGGKLKNPAYFSPRGEGVIAADDPKNPLGEYWISIQGVDGQAVGKMSYGIHGTIDPDSIGKQSSMGCIRLRDADIALVYTLLVDGKSLIVVRD
ncbi:MAG TPA: L,D-transpeptidase family protein [Tepidisphaeraceae bacterium]|nr:L,D-transpeptidase family protein [Tepidisphaeraceae bacterium]